MLKKYRWFILSSIVLIGLFLVWTLVQEEPIPAVQLKREDVLATLTVTGEVQAKHTVNFNPVVIAEIVSVAVDEGDFIRVGQPLITLNTAEPKAQAMQAQAQANAAYAGYQDLRKGTRPEEIQFQEQRFAEINHRLAQLEAALKSSQAQAQVAVRNAQRFQGLYHQELVSAQEYENAQLQASVAQQDINQRQADLSAARRQHAQIAAQLAEARNGPTQPALNQAKATWRAAQDGAKAAQAELGKYIITSNINGFVAARLKEPGDLSRPGEPILKAVDPNTLEIICSVEESDLAKVRRGNDAYVVFDANPRSAIPGRVRHVGSEVKAENGTVEARVVLKPNAWHQMTQTRILPGMTADVSIVTARLRNAMVIPASAMKSQDGETYVLRFVDHRLIKQPIQGERISLENFQVTSGLKPGDWIAAVADDKLIQKRRVKPSVQAKQAKSSVASQSSEGKATGSMGMSTR